MTVDQESAIAGLLGFPGVMLSPSKRNPPGREDHVIYWNACVFNHAGEQIWYGDLDVTAQQRTLQMLAKEIGTVYVTPEKPWRFDGFHETIKRDSARRRLIEFRGVN